jgi:hypothetical protein
MNYSGGHMIHISSVRRLVVTLGVLVVHLAADRTGHWHTAYAASMQAHLNRARPAVYLVLTRTASGLEQAVGTAWVVRPGVLATNAHVAEPLNHLEAGQKAYVRSNVAPYQTAAVQSVVVHPHYFAFLQAVQRYTPAEQGDFVEVVPGYDVGLLYVDTSVTLAPPLKVAGKRALERMAPGDEVGFVGYPMENMVGGGVMLSAPNPQTQIARITALSDFFLKPSGGLLVQHSLPSTGGASGSPILNADGEVIAVLSAGNMMQMPDRRRAPSAVGVNFAQRVDLVNELFEALVPYLLTEQRKDEWAASLRAFDRMEDHLPKIFFAQHGVGQVGPLLDRSVPLQNSQWLDRPSAKIEVVLPAAGYVLLMASIPDSPLVSMRSFGGMEIEVLDASGVSRVKITGPSHFASTTFETTGATTITAVLRTLSLYPVQLRAYFIAKKG